jgi:hypothetical protein
VVTPFDAVKIVAQKFGCSSLAAAKRLGPAGLFAGFGATMIWSVPSQGVFFVAYDWALDLHAERGKEEEQRGREERADKQKKLKDDSLQDDAAAAAAAAQVQAAAAAPVSAFAQAAARMPALPPGFLGSCFAGGWAGVAEWGFALPLDTVKTRVQAGDSPSFKAALKDVVNLHGPLGLYKGFVPVMARAFPSSAAAMAGIHLTETYFASEAYTGTVPAAAATNPEASGATSSESTASSGSSRASRSSNGSGGGDEPEGSTGTAPPSFAATVGAELVRRKTVTGTSPAK